MVFFDNEASFFDEWAFEVGSILAKHYILEKVINID